MEEVPFHLAVQHGCLTVARVIVGVSAGDSYDGIAESFKDLCTPEVLSQQLEKHSACGYRPIHYACASENVETVKWLHSQHVDVSIANYALDFVSFRVFRISLPAQIYKYFQKDVETVR